MSQPQRRVLKEIQEQQDVGSKGVQEKAAKKALPEKEGSIMTMDLIRKKEWLRNHKTELEAVLAKGVIPPSSNDIEELDDRIATLKSDLFELSIDHSIKERKLQSAQCGSVLKELLSNDSEHGEDGLFTKEEKQETSNMCRKQSELTTEILKELKETKEIQQELDKTKRQCLEMKKSNRDLMLKLQEKQNSEEKEQEKREDSREIQRRKNALEEVTTKICLVRGVFQGVIVGSGINWAEDPTLVETVIELGEPLGE